jgi:hypothetical protein
MAKRRSRERRRDNDRREKWGGREWRPNEAYDGIYNDSRATPERDKHRSRDLSRCGS